MGVVNVPLGSTMQEQLYVRAVCILASTVLFQPRRAPLAWPRELSRLALAHAIRGSSIVALRHAVHAIMPV